MIQITEAASEAILNILKSKGLDPEQFAVELNYENEIRGIAFTKQFSGVERRFGKLRANIDPRVFYGPDLIIDYGEINGRRGILIKEK